MNKQFIGLIAALLMSITLVQAAGLGAKKEYVKEISESFSIARDGEVIADSKYGDITVKTWDQAKVKFDVRIRVDARNQSEADEVFDRVNVEFSNGDDFAKVETDYESKSSFWSFWGSGSREEYRIDIDIYMPATCDLAVYNKYGNINAESLKADARVHMSYGNYRLKDVAGRLSTQLAYGNGTVLSCNELEAEIKYSKFSLKSCTNGHLETKYSKINIEEGEELRILSKYDNYDIWSSKKLRVDGKYDHYDLEQIHSIEAYGKYSTYKIENLQGSADFNMEYGEAKIDLIGKDFEEILANGKYTTFRFEVHEGATYNIDFEGSYTGVRYPDSMKKEVDDLDDTDKTLRGYVGSASSGARIYARTQYGSFHVK